MANAIAEFIIVEGYRYKVELVESTTKEVHDQLLRGDVDITLELWKENNLVWEAEGVKNGRITDLGKLYSGKQYWIVSKWYAEENDIKTVFDMQQHWPDFLDPDDPSKGLFFNCIVGWTCRDINKMKLKAYGLERYYNTVSPVSPKSLRAIYTNALARKLPVFGYYWEPNVMAISHQWHILEEPPYSEQVWQKVIEATSTSEDLMLKEACSYKDSGAHKIANSNLAKKAPDVFEMFEKMKIDSSLFNTILNNNNNEDYYHSAPREQARSFLLNYPEQWTPWVPQNIRLKIDQALQETKNSSMRR